MSDDAVALARALEHPFSLALAHVFASAVAQACRQTDRVRAHAEAAGAIARDQDFRLLLAWSSAFEGWAAAVSGNHEEGISRIVDAIAEARAAGSDQFLPHLAGLAADAYLMDRNTADGLKSVEDGLAVAARTGERFWNPELLRLRGELQIAQDPRGSASAAEHAFREAIEDARSQGAILLAVRAAVSLGRSLGRTGRGAEVCNLIFEMSQNLQHRTGSDVSEANAWLAKLAAR
jgi:predicted ATPase